MFLVLSNNGCQTKPHAGFGEMMQADIGTSRSYQVIDDFTGAAPSKSIEKFNVMPGDCFVTQWYDNCVNDRERAELSQRHKDIRIGTTEWYG